MTSAVGGIITIRIDGAPMRAKGAATYGLGIPKREAVMGVDGVHGFKETPQVAFIEFSTTDKGDLDLRAVQTLSGRTVMLSLANRKTVVLSNAYYAGEGTASTEEGEVAMRFEGESAEEFSA